MIDPALHSPAGEEPHPKGLVPPQTTPQPPQLFASACVSTQPPPHPVSGAAQQRPLEHVLAFAQSVPQVPQLALLVFVLTSQPFAGLPSQSPKPAAQVLTPQLPATHVLAETFAPEQTLPHAPQFAGSAESAAQ